MAPALWVLQRVLGLKKYETAWTMLHKLRRAMVRPGRDLLTGRVEVDERYLGGLEEGLPGRLKVEKALVVVAAQEDGRGIGRIRMRHIVDASAASLTPFVQDSVAPGSVIHTDGSLTGVFAVAEQRLRTRSHLERGASWKSVLSLKLESMSGSTWRL